MQTTKYVLMKDVQRVIREETTERVLAYPVTKYEIGRADGARSILEKLKKYSKNIQDLESESDNG